MLTLTNKTDIIYPLVGSADLLCQKRPKVCEVEHTVLPTNRRNGAFLLEENMETKVCFKCKCEKPTTEFRQYKSGVNEGHFCSYCKSCGIKYANTYKKSHPWLKHYENAYTRTHYPDNKEHQSYKERIFNITNYDVKELWFRDKAWLLNKPSLDRIDNDKGYFKSNCRFIELSENCARNGFSEQNKLNCKNKKRDIYGRFRKENL